MASDKAYAAHFRIDALVASRRTFTASGPLTLSASMQTIPGLSADLVVGEYHVRAQLMLNPASGTGIPTYQYAGSGGLALSHGRLTICEMFQLANTMVDWGADAALPTFLAGPAIGASLFDRLITMDGYLNVSNAGTLNIQAKLSSGTGSMVQFGSYLEVEQLS